MLKRKYRSFSGLYRPSLSVDLEDPKLEFLAHFLSGEVDQFDHHIIPSIERVLCGEEEESGFAGNALEADYNKHTAVISYQEYFQMYEGYSGPPSQVSTEDFYKLAKEFIYVKNKLRAGELEFPLVVEDGEWLVD